MEYEYSFNVNNIKPYVKYCKNNGYNFCGKNRQIRTIYRNKGLMARITQDFKGKKIIYSLDFKEDKLDKTDLIIRKESKKIVFDNIDNCEDILSLLNYEKDNRLDRIRIVFCTETVKFEIDEYLEPVKAYVVAIEGNKNNVDEVYSDLSSLNDKHKL